MVVCGGSERSLTVLWFGANADFGYKVGFGTNEWWIYCNILRAKSCREWGATLLQPDVNTSWSKECINGISFLMHKFPRWEMYLSLQWYGRPFIFLIFPIIHNALCRRRWLMSYSLSIMRHKFLKERPDYETVGGWIMRDLEIQVLQTICVGGGDLQFLA